MTERERGESQVLGPKLLFGILLNSGYSTMRMVAIHYSKTGIRQFR
jgi:hypothetical protein